MWPGEQSHLFVTLACSKLTFESAFGSWRRPPTRGHQPGRLSVTLALESRQTKHLLTVSTFTEITSRCIFKSLFEFFKMYLNRLLCPDYKAKQF